MTSIQRPLSVKTLTCQGDQIMSHIPRHSKALTTIFLVLAVSTAFTITAFLFLWHYDVSIKINISKKQTVNEKTHSMETTSQNFTIASRESWRAQPPSHPLDPLTHPLPYVIIHFTATKSCSTPPECSHYVRNIQIFHMRNRKWWDIGYNFLIGGDGQVYEGRGWTNMGAHTKGYNSKSVGIAFIGTFNDGKPPEKQLDACRLLIAEGVNLGYVDNDYKLFGARQFQPPLSPGDALYEEIKTWKHWSKSVI